MTMRPLMSSCAVIAFVVSTASLAQDAPGVDPSAEAPEGEPADESMNPDEIVVTADRLRAQVDAAQAPILELDEADIAAYGVSSIADLVEELGAVTESTRGRGDSGPVILVNGIRVESFRELRSYPPEALRKMEVLPEEVAQKFGFSPDRRVLNFILKENYAAITGEVEYEQPDRGGYSQTEQEVTLLKIAKGGRINVNLEVNDKSLLTEAERNIVQTESSVSTVAGDPDQAPYRSLSSDTFSFQAEGGYAKTFKESGASLSVGGTFTRNESRSLSGLNSVLLTDPDDDINTALRTFDVDNPLETRTSSDSGSASLSYSRPIGDFQLSLTGNGGLTYSTSEIDLQADTTDLLAAVEDGTLAIDGALPALADAGFATNRTTSKTASTKATLRGNPVMLPSGELGVTFDLGYDWANTQTSDTRTDIDTDLTRSDINGGINLAVPLTSTREDFLSAVGDISLNFSAGFEKLSDFGTLYDWSSSLVWSPFRQLNLSATYTNSKSAPGLSQLTSPEIVTFNVSTFDFVQGETVLATITSGGNPFLIAATQSDWNFSANWKVPFGDNIRVQTTYTRNRSNDVSSSFPTLTEAVEAAFPDRVTRDTDGTLLAIDQRPVGYAETSLDRLSFGLNLRGRFGKADTPRGGAGGPQAGGPQAGGRQAGGRRGGGRGPGALMIGGGGGQGRFFVNLSHTLDLRNEILIAPGVPVLDQIGGDGGVSRNNTKLRAGMFRGGMGMRLTGSYIGPATIDGSELAASSDLNFGALAKVDLRVFADLGTIFKKQDGLLKGMRIALRADNLFDGVRRVTDESGEVPLTYQPALLDPVGRYLGIDIRKML